MKQSSLFSLWAKTFFCTCKIPCVAMIHATYTIGFNWLCTEGRRWFKNATRTLCVMTFFPPLSFSTKPTKIYCVTTKYNHLLLFELDPNWSSSIIQRILATHLMWDLVVKLKLTTNSGSHQKSDLFSFHHWYVMDCPLNKYFFSVPNLQPSLLPLNLYEISMKCSSRCI